MQRGNISLVLSQPHEALSSYEQALSHFPDHPTAIVQISGILLDIYAGTIPAEPPSNTLQPTSNISPPTSTSRLINPASNQAITSNDPTTQTSQSDPSTTSPATVTVPQISTSTITTSPIPSSSPPTRVRDSRPTAATLSTLAARDRAYMLLSTLTKLGEGWDCAEAWMALSRCHELSGRLDKASECLWWVVELEDSRPVRGWGVVGR